MTSTQAIQMTTPVPEEAAARFITTRPQINILKAHTSLIGDNPKPSFAAPTVTHPAQNHLSIPSTIGIPIVPYSRAAPVMHNYPAMPPPPYPDVKSTPTTRTCVLLPVIKPRQYLPPPPPSLPRQPPPPPPAQLATVYTSQLARSQIELYQQQLYSDVDYVIYPLQDPAVSQQDYLDAKQGSILAAMAQSPPAAPYLAFHHPAAGNHHGTWDACKGHAIYRSTPYLSMARYASTQNLSDTYVQLPSGAYSPLYSPSVASLCSSYDAPPPPPPFRPRPMATATMFTRSKSDDNILNSIETMPKAKRLPPPPPPPYNCKKPTKPPMPTPFEHRSTMLNREYQNAAPKKTIKKQKLIPKINLPFFRCQSKASCRTATIDDIAPDGHVVGCQIFDNPSIESPRDFECSEHGPSIAGFDRVNGAAIRRQSNH